jgi:hypothetical protein
VWYRDTGSYKIHNLYPGESKGENGACPILGEFVFFLGGLLRARSSRPTRSGGAAFLVVVAIIVFGAIRHSPGAVLASKLLLLLLQLLQYSTAALSLSLRAVYPNSQVSYPSNPSIG